MRGQFTEGLGIHERGDERFDGAVGRRHLRGQQTSVLGVPCPADLCVVCRTDGDDDTIEDDGRAVAAAVVSCGCPFRIFQTAKLLDVGIRADRAGEQGQEDEQLFVVSHKRALIDGLCSISRRPSCRLRFAGCSWRWQDGHRGRRLAMLRVLHAAGSGQLPYHRRQRQYCAA